MQTIPKSAAVDPRMLKMGYTPSRLGVGVGAGGRGGNNSNFSEDVTMRTTPREVAKERMLQPWEREILERADVKRKATVAQIYFLDYYCKLCGEEIVRRTNVGSQDIGLLLLIIPQSTCLGISQAGASVSTTSSRTRTSVR